MVLEGLFIPLIFLNFMSEESSLENTVYRIIFARVIFAHLQMQTISSILNLPRHTYVYVQE